MADLISKVVRSGSTERQQGEWYSNNTHMSNSNHPSRSATKTMKSNTDGPYVGSTQIDTNIISGKTDGIHDGDQVAGIMKTVTTVVVKSDYSEDSGEEYELKSVKR